MENNNEKYREHLLSLAREGKLSIMQGSDLGYQCFPTNDGKYLVVATGVGCTACFTPEEWHNLLDEVYSSNQVYQASFEDIVAIPYKDEDGWSCVRYELKEKSQQISREEARDKYIAQGTTTTSHPFQTQTGVNRGIRGVLIDKYLSMVDKDKVSVIDYGKWISFQESYPPLQDKAYNGVVIEILHEGSPHFHSLFHDGERVFLRCYDWHNDLLEWELPEFTNDYWRFVPAPPGNEGYDVG